MQAAQGGSIIEKQPNSRMCFLCGMKNPNGLKLAFNSDGQDRCITRFRPRPEHQGYPGYPHGGIISALSAKTMGRALIAQEVWAIAGKPEVGFREPVPLDQESTVIGAMTRNRLRAYEARGEIRLLDGTALVEDSGRYVRITNDLATPLHTASGFKLLMPCRRRKPEPSSRM